MEPVEGGAVDERRELAGADAEAVSHRAEAQHHMQVLAHLRNFCPVKNSVLDMQLRYSAHGCETQHDTRTFSMKKSHRFSAVSMRPSALTSLRTALLNCSLSSWNMRTACHALCAA